MPMQRGAKLSAVAAICLVVILSLFPLTPAFAYWQYLRDEVAGTGTYFKYADSSNTRWSFPTNQPNGYDNDTGVDCLEEYSWCQSGTTDWASYYPSNPSAWWLCPKAHVASLASWSSNYARYTSHTAGAISYADMKQSYYLNAWYDAPNAKYYGGDYLHVNNMGGGDGSISVDMMAFHYNPNNSNDSSCA